MFIQETLTPSKKSRLLRHWP